MVCCKQNTVTELRGQADKFLHLLYVQRKPNHYTLFFFGTHAAKWNGDADIASDTQLNCEVSCKALQQQGCEFVE
jgi:hypothetical protein